MALPTDDQERKNIPLFTGCIDYFPDALIEVAKVSQEGNEQHHPDKPLHWDKTKSTDHVNSLCRHMVEGDWRKVAWRALAQLQTELEKEQDVKYKVEYDLAITKATLVR